MQRDDSVRARVDYREKLFKVYFKNAAPAPAESARFSIFWIVKEFFRSKTRRANHAATHARKVAVFKQVNVRTHIHVRSARVHVF